MQSFSVFYSGVRSCFHSLTLAVFLFLLCLSWLRAYFDINLKIAFYPPRVLSRHSLRVQISLFARKLMYHYAALKCCVLNRLNPEVLTPQNTTFQGTRVSIIESLALQ